MDGLFEHCRCLYLDAALNKPFSLIPSAPNEFLKILGRDAPSLYLGGADFLQIDEVPESLLGKVKALGCFTHCE